MRATISAVLAGLVVSAATLEAQKPGAGQPSTGGQASSGSDPWVGTFATEGLSITLRRSGQNYTGTAASQGGQYQLQARVVNGVLSGVYTDNGVQRTFQALVQGDVMQLEADGTQFMLQRQSRGQPAQLGQGQQGRQGQGGQGGGGQLASSAQDRQIAQLLLSSRWCSFAYSQISGRTDTEQVQFYQDGTVSQGAQHETQSSNPNGQYYGNSSNSNRARWRIENGMLMLSQDGQQWAATQLSITQNSNGSPIITANGREYSRCN